MTRTRLRVLRHLRNVDAPVSHADVYRDLESEGLDRTTAYRVLLDLAATGIVRRFDVDHVFRFELVADASDDGAHPHFVCRECGVVACLPPASVHVERDGAPVGVDLEVQVRGTCHECARAG